MKMTKMTKTSLHLVAMCVALVVFSTVSACDPTDEGNDPAGFGNSNDTNDTARASDSTPENATDECDDAPCEPQRDTNSSEETDDTSNDIDTSAISPDTDSATAPSDTNSATISPDTDSATAPSDTDSAAIYLDTDSATAPSDTDSAAISPDTDSATAPSDTDSATTPSDTATIEEDTDSHDTDNIKIIPLDICEKNGWCSMPLPTTIQDGISFLHGCSETDIWGTSSDGMLIHYDGDNWTTVDIPASGEIQEVYCVSENNVWGIAEGGRAVHYNGSNWNVIQTGASYLHALWANEEIAVFTGAENTLWKYQSNGLSEIEVPVLPDDIPDFNYPGQVYDREFSGVWGSNTNDIWIGAKGFFLHITETGPQWQHIEGDDYMSNAIYSIIGLSDTILWTTTKNIDVDETGVDLVRWEDGQPAGYYWPHNAISEFAGISTFSVSSENLLYAIGHGTFANNLAELHIYKNGNWWLELQFNSAHVGRLWSAANGELFVPVEGQILHHPGY